MCVWFFLLSVSKLIAEAVQSYLKGTVSLPKHSVSIWASGSLNIKKKFFGDVDFIRGLMEALQRCRFPSGKIKKRGGAFRTNQ